MEVEFFGANCFRIKTKKTTLVFDDNLDSIGGKSIIKDNDVVFYSLASLMPEKPSKARLIIDSAGEFEVGDISIKALQTRSHMDEEGKQTATVYQCLFGGTTVTILGHINPELADDVAELVGGTDVLVLPVGGNGYTMDSIGAVSVIKKMEPSVVIASQYDVPGLNYEVPAAPLDDFRKAGALNSVEPKDAYKVDKPDVELTAQTHQVILNVVKA